MGEKRTKREEETGKKRREEAGENTGEGTGKVKRIESGRCRDRTQQRLDSFHSLQLNLLLIGFSHSAGSAEITAKIESR